MRVAEADVTIPDDELSVGMGDEQQTTYSAKDGNLYFPDPDTGQQSEIDCRIEMLCSIDSVILGLLSVSAPRAPDARARSRSSGSDAAPRL
jgi:hypothetical protein